MNISWLGSRKDNHVNPQNRGCYLAQGQDIDHKTLSREVDVTFASLNKIQCGFFQYM